MTRASDIPTPPHRRRADGSRWARRPKIGTAGGSRTHPTTDTTSTTPTTEVWHRRIRTPAGRGWCGIFAAIGRAALRCALCDSPVTHEVREPHTAVKPTRCRGRLHSGRCRPPEVDHRSSCQPLEHPPQPVGTACPHTCPTTAVVPAAVLFGAVLGKRLVDHLAGQLGRIAPAGQQPDQPPASSLHTVSHGGIDPPRDQCPRPIPLGIGINLSATAASTVTSSTPLRRSSVRRAVTPSARSRCLAATKASAYAGRRSGRPRRIDPAPWPRPPRVSPAGAARFPARPWAGPLRSAAAGRSPSPPPPDYRERPPDGRRVLRVAARAGPLFHSTRWVPMPRCLAAKALQDHERALHCDRGLHCYRALSRHRASSHHRVRPGRAIRWLRAARPVRQCEPPGTLS